MSSPIDAFDLEVQHRFTGLDGQRYAIVGDGDVRFVVPAEALGQDIETTPDSDDDYGAWSREWILREPAKVAPAQLLEEYSVG